VLGYGAFRVFSPSRSSSVPNPTYARCSVSSGTTIHPGETCSLIAGRSDFPPVTREPPRLDSLGALRILCGRSRSGAGVGTCLCGLFPVGWDGASPVTPGGISSPSN